MGPRTEVLTNIAAKIAKMDEGKEESILPEQPVTLSRGTLTTMVGALVEMSQIIDDWSDDEEDEGVAMDVGPLGPTDEEALVE